MMQFFGDEDVTEELLDSSEAEVSSLNESQEGIPGRKNGGRPNGQLKTRNGHPVSIRVQEPGDLLAHGSSK